MDTVVVSVIGIQRDQIGEENRLELITVGRHYQKNNIDYIRYEESAVSGLEGTTTTLKISDRRLLLLRSGKVQQRLVFQQDAVSDSLYRTPLGNFNLSVKTNKFTVELSKGLGKIQVAYELLLDGQWQSANQLVIEIQEERKS
jgi:uncharacterized beta-barrel protein YwiB (DUF1934 family)